MASSSTAFVSPSLSVTGEHSTRPSRSVRSPVWNFFEYDATTENSVCQVELSEHVICAHSISGKYPTNLKQHLKRCHPEAHSQVLQVESSIKKAKSEVKAKRCSSSHKAAATSSKQLNLSQALSSGKKYRKESDRYQAITKKLAVFVGSSNVANSIVQSPEFKDLLNTLDGRYKMPGRSAISNEVGKVLIEIKARASAFLQEASKGIHLCQHLVQEGVISFFSWSNCPLLFEKGS